jgi:hypothetical protein
MEKLLTTFILGLLFWGQTNAQNGDSISINNISVGNNPGNIINHGLIVTDNERIYYVSTTSESGLFSMKIDGTDIKKLSNDNIEYLNVLKGWLYYRKIRSNKNSNGGLYKMKTDGTQEQRLTSNEPFYINVVNDWIFYINWSSTDVCKIKIDGTNQQVLYPGHYQCLTTDGSFLYFGEMAGAGTSILCKGSFNGSEIKNISTDTLENFFVYGDWIYYTKDYNKVCRVNKNNFEVDTLLVDDNLNADYIIPDKNSLYFGGVFGIQRFDIQEKKAHTLFSKGIIEFGLAANYIYYTTAEWGKNNERHTKTFITKLDNLKPAK